MFQYCKRDCNGEYNPISYCEPCSNLCGSVSDSHRCNCYRWRHLLLVAGRTNNSKYYCESCYNNQLYCYLLIEWMFRYRVNSSGRKFSSTCYHKLRNNLRGTISNSHCYTCARRRHLFMVAGRTGHTKYYCESGSNNKLYSYLLIEWLFKYWNRSSNRECSRIGFR